MALTVERIELRAIHDPDPELHWLLGLDDIGAHINSPDPEWRKDARLAHIQHRQCQRGERWYVHLVVDAVVTTDSNGLAPFNSYTYTSGPVVDVPSWSSAVDVVDIWAELTDLVTENLPADAITPTTDVVVVSTPAKPESGRTVLVVKR